MDMNTVLWNNNFTHVTYVASPCSLMAQPDEHYLWNDLYI